MPILFGADPIQTEVQDTLRLCPTEGPPITLWRGSMWTSRRSIRRSWLQIPTVAC